MYMAIFRRDRRHEDMGGQPLHVAAFLNSTFQGLAIGEARTMKPPKGYELVGVQRREVVSFSWVFRVDEWVNS